MNRKTLAIFGIGAYILSILSSATDLEGNSTAPIALIVVSGIATATFVVLVIARLWEESRGVSIALGTSALILLILLITQEIIPSSYGSLIILLLNVAKVINFVAFIWAIVKLFKTTQKRRVSVGQW